MHRELLHLYGPFSINSFGFMIVLGLIIFSIFLLKDPKRSKLITQDQYFTIISISILTGLLGGRILFVLENLQSFDSFWQIFAIWEGGFSLLGTVFALLIIMPFYFIHYHIKGIAFLDLAALYAPLLQAISRIGCFLAGCCFGIPTYLPIGITNGQSAHLLIHPTQLYSAASLFILFLFLYFVVQHRVKYSGQLVGIYVILMSQERFIIDFWRGDRQFLQTAFLNFFSLSQYIALGVTSVGLILFSYFTFYHKQRLP